MRRLALFAFAATLAVLLACAAALPMATERDALLAGVPLPDLHAGRARYVAKCSGCHRLYAPPEYDDTAWALYVPAMRKRARLSDNDVAAILDYVTAVNGASPEPVASAPQG